MKIYIEEEDKTLNKKFRGKGKELLKTLKINPETVLLTRNSELITVDDSLKDKDEIKILSVISGG
jgi:sulfur carrier protein ThiS